MRLAAAAARRALVASRGLKRAISSSWLTTLHERSAADARAELPPGTPARWASLRAQAILGRLEAAVSTPRGGRMTTTRRKMRVEAAAAAAAALEAALVGGLRAGGLRADQRARAPPKPSGGGFFAMCCGGGAAEVVVEAPTVTRNADDAVRVGVGAHASLLKLCLHAAAADGAPRAARPPRPPRRCGGPTARRCHCRRRFAARRRHRTPPRACGRWLFRALEAAASPSRLPRAPPPHAAPLGASDFCVR